MAKPRNDRNHAVTKFCLAMEDHRRTEAGRVRTAKEFVAHFFPHDEHKANDQLFVHMPNEVRGPVLAKWGVRGAKAALKDDDEKVKLVVHDALLAGDIDDSIFESGVEPAILIDWIVLAEWWSFWRQGRLTGVAIQKALATARELGLIDDAWFLFNVQGRGGRLKGTDVLCDTLSKDQLVGWIRKIHASGDGSPAGLIAALGWDVVLAKTAQEALLFALDQFARNAGLAPESGESKSGRAPAVEGKASAGGVAGSTAGAPSPAFSSGPSRNGESATARHEQLPETHVTVNAPGDAAAIAEADALANASRFDSHLDEGMAVAIPDIPVVDGGDDEPASSPSLDARSEWSAQHVEESPKLAEAREAMMQTLMSAGATTTAKAEDEPWHESEAPQTPSSLEWPEPPPSVANATGSHVSDEPIALDEDDLLKASAPNVPLSIPPPIPQAGPHGEPRKPGNAPPRPR